MESPSTSPTPPLAGKRILYAVTKSNGGGAQAYVRMLASGARLAGAEVAVAAGSGSGKGGVPGILFNELEEDGIRTIHLQTMMRDISLIDEWQSFKELRRILKEERPDVLHLNSSKMGLVGALAGRLSGVHNILFTAHGWPHKEQRSLVWKLIAWTGSWLTIFLCHEVICVAETDLRDSPTFFFRDRLHLVHNGVPDFPRVSKEEARAAFITRAPELAAYSKLLLMNAELHPNKGVSTAIRALAELSVRDKDIALVVCGEGEERDALRNLAGELEVADRVFLLGFVQGARQYLTAADIFLLPSRKEGLPLALLEAGLASLPVIASKVGGIPEVLTDHVSGLFMPRSNTHILAQSIHHLLEHPDEGARMGAALRNKVLTDFSERAMVRNTLAMYR